MNTEDFVTYEQAVKLKECGFDCLCICYYNRSISRSRIIISGRELSAASCDCDEILCPSLSQAAKWLREVKGIDIDVRTDCIGGRKYNYVLYDGDRQFYARDNYTTYEPAFSAGIDAALELIKAKI